MEVVVGQKLILHFWFFKVNKVLVTIIILSFVWHFIILSIKVFTVAKFEKLEGLPVLLTHIVDSSEAVQVVDEMKHFFVCFIIVEGNDRDSIVYLEGKAVYAIINDYHILQISFTKDTKVFYIVALGGEEAVLAIQTVLYQLVVWVDIV
jgi:hypothetical protein